MRDQHGEPIFGVAVVVHAPSGERVMAVTDEAGGWALDLDGDQFSVELFHGDVSESRVLHVDEAVPIHDIVMHLPDEIVVW